MTKRVFAYYDGSNFYHLAKDNYGLTGFDYVKLTSCLLKPDEKLIKIKYFNAPVNQQEEPEMYKEQQKFFSHLSKEPLIKLYLGSLVKRNFNKITIWCPKCKDQLATDLNCPKCGRLIDLKKARRTVEKGVDVKITIQLLLDALADDYDIALLISSDADFVPAVEYITKSLKREIVYCHFDYPFTSDLVKNCSETRLIKKEMLQNCLV